MGGEFFKEWSGGPLRAEIRLTGAHVATVYPRSKRTSLFTNPDVARNALERWGAR